MAPLSLIISLGLVLYLPEPCCPVAVPGSIIGDRETCNIEGEDFTVNKIPNTRCFNCICKNGFVECLKRQCPSTEGCYTLLSRQNDECCQVCKGCTLDDVQYASGTEWSEPNNPCRLLSCNAGIITRSEIRCYTPCPNPKPPAVGQCCPTCGDCYMDEQDATDGRTLTFIGDPCVTCKCDMGRLTCIKRACPVLHCPSSRIIHDVRECCPRCTGSGQYLLPPRGACILGRTLHDSGSQFQLDECTLCTCTNSTISCIKQTCPILECPRENQTTSPDQCCPQCAIIERDSSCIYGGENYRDGETWKPDRCKSCTCIRGNVRCARTICPRSGGSCPINTKLEQPVDQCCPRCVESDGVCTAFGDPHYQTFDGKSFTFNGPCKYQLSGDCVDHTFSIRVTNHAKPTRYSAWSKAISLKMGGMRVNLGQRMRIKVNGKRVSVPYLVPELLYINRTEDSILVNTRNGIKVLWNGFSFLEITVPTFLRGRLCGLCGNFNSFIKDDFSTPRGDIFHDPHPFGESWVIGGRKACSKKVLSNSDKQGCKGKRNRRLCNQLMGHAFESCHGTVNPSSYYRACLQDMCGCTVGNCNCESFMAYVHSCERLGVELLNWRNLTRCRSVWDLLPDNGRRKMWTQPHLSRP